MNITVSELQSLLEQPGWTHEQYIEEYNREEFERFESPDVSQSVTVVHGASVVESKRGDITLKYVQSFEFTLNNEDSLVWHDECDVDSVWFIYGFMLIDSDGDQVSAAELYSAIYDAEKAPEFTDFLTDIDGINETIDIDIDEDIDMKTITLTIDNAPNIRFTGEKVAHASTHPDQAMGSSWSGETGRWTVLDLYRTTSGKYVCHQIGRTQWQGEQDRYSGKVCDTEAEIIEFFGHRWLAKELYESAGFEDVQEV
ncbi:MAG: hypothetical protein O2780_12480 [Proteobacteria bacterium]|nr:hypothetical protein [Pseudomonadota bacterium]